MNRHTAITVQQEFIWAFGREVRTRAQLLELLTDNRIETLDILVEAGAPYELIGMAIYTAHRCVAAPNVVNLPDRPGSGG
jgi:hypothetical protein